VHEITKRRRRNCGLRQVTEGKTKGGIEVNLRQGRTRRNLLDDLKERIGYFYLREWSSRSHYVDSSLWKRLWAYRETDC
jgi:hypothetical protein